MPNRHFSFSDALSCWHPVSQPAGAEQPGGHRGAPFPAAAQPPVGSARLGPQGLSPGPPEANGAAGSGFVEDPLLVSGTGFTLHKQVVHRMEKCIPLVSMEILLSA